jgi:hypothetical protein
MKMILAKYFLKNSALLLSVLFVFELVVSCSNEDSPLRLISGHDQFYQGIGHPIGAARAERLCSSCHGKGLSGGKELQPSCYQCHGKNWLDSDPSLSLAPADHTESYGGYLHSKGSRQPAANCGECHGANLAGDVSKKRPSCFLCHKQIWD